MNNAQSILQNIIDDFSPQKFTRFFREISGGNFRELNENIPGYNNDYFSEGLMLGEIDCTNAKFCVSTFKSNKALSERSGKKAQYELAKKYLKNNEKYKAGIFIFYDAEGNFRFSLIFDIPQPKGKRDWSSFKRFTYFVSRRQTNKTFITRIGSADFTSFDQLRDAFSVDKVTKDFYREIAGWYFWAMDNVQFPDDEDKNADERNAKNLIRLITRIIFVWFMKEKNLVPPDLFEKNTIDKIINYDDSTGSTYYKAILQNLFFATLNTKMKRDEPNSGTSRSRGRIFIEEAKQKGFLNEGYLQQGYYRYSRFVKDKDLFLKLFENIPFLNGGLFESLDKKVNGKEIRIDCFSDNPKNESRLKVPDELFFLEEEISIDLSNHLSSGKNKKVRGLLPILKSYNFTIDENTPIDEEVALDPELLGKVFENLLASYNPETATTARKSTGSYYTPREIVEYMVNESLVENLKTALGIEDKDDEVETKIRNLFDYNKEENPFADDKNRTEKIIDAIEKVKILDPACGSGAFPMGILHKLVLALHKLDPENKIWKKRLLERVPAEIREETEISLHNKPLDYVRKLGLIENCIYGVDIQEIAIQISKLRFFISLLVEQEIDDTKENRDVRSLPNLETKFVAANTLIGLEKPEQLGLVSNEIDDLEKELFKKRKDLFYANSRWEKLKLQKEEKELREKLKTALQNNDFNNDVAEKIASWDPFDQNRHADWFDPEWMFGTDVKNGFNILIGNPPYVEHKKLKNISSLLKNNYITYSGTADLYVYFYENGIKHLRENGTLVFITSNKFIKTSYGLNLRKYFTNYHINEIIDFTEVHVFEALVASCIFSVTKRNDTNNKLRVSFANDSMTNFSNLSDFINQNNFILPQHNLSEKIWQLENETNLKLKQKIESGSVTLGEIATIKIYRGVTTGYNPAFIIDEEKQKELIKEDKANKTIIKPLLQGRNIRKWAYNKTSAFLIFTRKGIDIKKYPSIKKHLGNFKRQLEPGVGRKAGSYNWYEIQDNTAYYPEFEKEKIIWGLTSDKWTFAYDNGNNFLPSNGYILTSTKIPIKYLLALLNSKLMEYYFGFIGIMTAGGAYTLKQETVSEFPIKIISDTKQFSTCVDKILTAKRINPQADTQHLEDQIDIMVYKLYELTYEEVKIIDADIEKIISKEDYEEFEIK